MTFLPGDTTAMLLVAQDSTVGDVLKKICQKQGISSHHFHFEELNAQTIPEELLASNLKSFELYLKANGNI